MRRLLVCTAVVMSLLLAGVLADSARAASPLRTLAAPRARGDSAAPRLSAAVLLQRSDCTGNLRLLDLLHRSDLADRLTLRAIWYVGPASDTLALRALLPRWTARIALVPAGRLVLHEFRRLGHASTPVLLMYDQDGRVRLTSQSPRSLREFAGLRRAVEGLTWIEEL